jgi:hypothetical protein
MVFPIDDCSSLRYYPRLDFEQFVIPQLREQEEVQPRQVHEVKTSRDVDWSVVSRYHHLFHFDTLSLKVACAVGPFKPVCMR